MAALRLFVGLPLPEEYQRVLDELRRAWQQRLRSKLSWTRTGNWHVTLKFLGDTEEAQIGRIEEALRSVSWRAFTLQARGGGFFPPPKGKGPLRPRVVWVGLGQGVAETVALAKAVETALVPLGIGAETRPFRAHLTLARVKFAASEDGAVTHPVSGSAPGPAAGDGWAGLLGELLARDWPPCETGRFILWRSHLGPGGPVYEPLAEFPAGS